MTDEKTLVEFQRKRQAHLDSLWQEGRGAEALSVQFNDDFDLFSFRGENIWQEVTDWLMDDSRHDTICERPDLFLLHIGMNNIRTSVMVLLWRNGMLDRRLYSTDPEEMKRRVMWLLDGSHGTVMCYENDWRSIIDYVWDDGGLMADGDEAREWLEKAQESDELITLYRGGTTDYPPSDGFLWTTEKRQAIFFARKYSSEGECGMPIVATAQVPVSDINGAMFGRENQVAVLDLSNSEITTEGIHSNA